MPKTPPTTPDTGKTKKRDRNDVVDSHSSNDNHTPQTLVNTSVLLGAPKKKPVTQEMISFFMQNLTFDNTPEDFHDANSHTQETAPDVRQTRFLNRLNALPERNENMDNNHNPQLLSDEESLDEHDEAAATMLFTMSDEPHSQHLGTPYIPRNKFTTGATPYASAKKENMPSGQTDQDTSDDAQATVVVNSNTEVDTKIDTPTRPASVYTGDRGSASSSPLFAASRLHESTHAINHKEFIDKIGVVAQQFQLLIDSTLAVLETKLELLHDFLQTHTQDNGLLIVEHEGRQLILTHLQALIAHHQRMQNHLFLFIAEVIQPLNPQRGALSYSQKIFNHFFDGQVSVYQNHLVEQLSIYRGILSTVTERQGSLDTSSLKTCVQQQLFFIKEMCKQPPQPQSTVSCLK